MIDARKYARKSVLTIEPYPMGKPVEEMQAELGLSELAMMATNENPLGPSPLAMEAAVREMRRASVYPDGGCVALARKLAGRLGIEPSMVALGNGGDNCITMIATAFLEQGDEVVVCDPSFPVYGIAAAAAGAETVRVPHRAFTHDLEAMRRQVGPRTKLVIVCNPNNPTGTLVNARELEGFVRGMPEGVLTLLDEAYREFASGPDAPDGLRFVREGLPVLCLRTFSKAYGLAGLRVGYLLGDPGLLDAIRRVREAYPVSRPAQAAACAALDDGEFLRRTLAHNEESKAYLCRELSRLGLPFVPTAANFMFVDLRCDAADAARVLLARGFQIRPGAMWRLPTWARISFGTMAQNRAFIQALGDIPS
jgi:histidinol-phosphate aminotransferase